MPISEMEDQIAKLCGLYQTISGITGASSFGVKNTKDISTVRYHEDSDDQSMETVNVKSPFNISSKENIVPSGSNRVRENTLKKKKDDDEIKSYIENQTLTMNNIADNISQLLDIAKDNRNSLKRTYRAIENLVDLKKRKIKEIERHNMMIEKQLLEKNEIKKRCLEIKEIHLQMAQAD